MSYTSPQKGFTVIEIVVVVIILAIFGGGGYLLWQSQQSKVDSSMAGMDMSKSGSTSKIAAKTWKAGGMAIEGTYADASVIQLTDTTWRMYYAIQPEVPGHHFEVYSSTSTDGKTWTQEAGTRKTMATFPDVIKLADGRYRMYFQSAGVIKSAISSDGLTFTDESGNRADLSSAANAAYENAAAPTVMINKDGSYTMVYRATLKEKYNPGVMVPNQTAQLLLWSTSADGLTFTEKGIAVDTRNDTYYGQLDGPQLVAWDDDLIKLFATTYTGVYSFDFNGTVFSNGTLELAGEATHDNMGFHGSPPGDPTLAEIAGIWFMYYGAPSTTPGIGYATYH